MESRMARRAALVIAVLVLVLLAVPAAARDWGETVQRINDSVGALAVALGALGTVVGYMAKSPKQAGYSQKIMDAALYLQSEHMRRILNAMQDLSEGPAGRRRVAMDLVMSDPIAERLEFTQDDAGKLVDYLAAQYKRAPDLVNLVTRRR